MFQQPDSGVEFKSGWVGGGPVQGLLQGVRRRLTVLAPPARPQPGAAALSPDPGVTKQSPHP